jgi:CheY-like chemotaxis protein
VELWKAADTGSLQRSDADEAIDVLERLGDIELVITDINMPGSMDGVRLAAAIRPST